MNWKEIKGYEGLYFVSDTGLIKNRKGLIIKQQKQNSGYYLVHLYKENKRKALTVHRLVAIAFLGEKEDMQVDHIDFNKLNNNVSNLQWMSNLENNRKNWIEGKMEVAREKARKTMSKIGKKYKIQNGNRLRELNKLISKPIARVDEDGKILETFDSIKHARRSGYQNVNKVLSGKSEKCKGFNFIRI